MKSPMTSFQCNGAQKPALVSIVHRNGAETAATLLFGSYAFLLLVCYYVVKLLREPLLLVGGSAELKSYAHAAIALALMLLVPLYAALFRRTSRLALVRSITLFFAANLAVFYALGRVGVDVGFFYYVWVGVFGAVIVAQFWAHAAHCFGVGAGARVFPPIMLGATLGGLLGPPLVSALYPYVGAWNLMLLAAALLLATWPLLTATRRVERAAARGEPPAGHSKGGFALILGDRYLLLLAALVVVFNCVNTMGEYLLTDLVLEAADAAGLEDGATSGAFIADFYGDFYLAVNALTVALQTLVVGRVFRRIGIEGAVLAVPVVALLGYGLIAFFPVFAVVGAFKVVENSVDYSLMNTARHALYLPLPEAQQYQGKTAIDGFFWRLGDVVQAGIVFAGLHWLGFGFADFALLNGGLALAWLALAAAVANRYRRAAGTRSAPRRRLRLRAAAAALGAIASLAAGRAAAAPADAPLTGAPEKSLFAERTPLELELVFEKSSFCRARGRAGCDDAPATLRYRAETGDAIDIAVSVRARGRWREDTADCRLPALFIFFDPVTAAGTPFAGERMLPLTTHCHDAPNFEQNVLEEYLAYRIYELVSAKALRTRLAQVTYRSANDAARSTRRYAFFTEHFDALAARHGATVWEAESVDAELFDADELATMAVFQYMIGNTDWSAIYGHNIMALRSPTGAVTAVPYDFDFSGLVDAAYAGPPPGLPIDSVRERIFRGFCSPRPDWSAVFAEFTAQRAAVAALPDTIPGLGPRERARAGAYIEAFYAVLESPQMRAARIVGACRAPERRKE